MAKLNILERLHKLYENLFKDAFGRWGRFVALHPACTFFFSFLFLALLISGFAFVQTYPDSTFNWAAQNGWVLESNLKAVDAYSGTFAGLSLIIESKQSNLLTVSAYNELLSLTNEIYNAQYTNDDGETYTIRDFSFREG